MIKNKARLEPSKYFGDYLLKSPQNYYSSAVLGIELPKHVKLKNVDRLLSGKDRASDHVRKHECEAVSHRNIGKLIPTEALLPRIISPVIQPENPKLAHISIVGLVNSGKSTLVNTLIGSKVSATSSKAQTTRDVVMGIFTRGDSQLIFNDIPGLISRKMTHGATISNVDGIVYMLEVISAQKSLERCRDHIEFLSEKNVPLSIVLNKIDLLSSCKERTTSLIESIKDGLLQKLNLPFFPISCKHDHGVNQLRDFLLTYAVPNRPWLYAKDQTHLLPDVEFVKEVIREKVYRRLNKEIPYKIDIEVMAWNQKHDRLYIEVALVLPKERLRPMIIGNNGRVLNYIQTNAQNDLEMELRKQIHVQLVIMSK